MCACIAAGIFSWLAYCRTPCLEEPPLLCPILQAAREVSNTEMLWGANEGNMGFLPCGRTQVQPVESGEKLAQPAAVYHFFYLAVGG